VIDLSALLAPDRLVDLTQPLGPSTVLWPGSTPFGAVVDADYDTHGGYARTLTLPEHSGTHLDAPAHFHRGGPTTEAIPLSELVLPAVKLDVRDLVADNPAAEVPAAAIEAIEARDGRLPAGCAVLVHTGWDAYVHDRTRYVGANRPALPGLAADAGRLLVERGVRGVGIDTLGIDPGHSTSYAVHRTTLPAGLWHLEGLVGLERVPPRGAWLVAAVLPVVAGSGAPARVFAILPAGTE
jgi:kynurenine formamidase